MQATLKGGMVAAWLSPKRICCLLKAFSSCQTPLLQPDQSYCSCSARIRPLFARVKASSAPLKVCVGNSCAILLTVTSFISAAGTLFCQPCSHRRNAGLQKPDLALGAPNSAGRERCKVCDCLHNGGKGGIVCPTCRGSKLCRYVLQGHSERILH